MRDTVRLECSECKRRNYTTSRNKRLKPARLTMKKYCKWCRCHSEHKETK